MGFGQILTGGKIPGSDDNPYLPVPSGDKEVQLDSQTPGPGGAEPYNPFPGQTLTQTGPGGSGGGAGLMPGQGTVSPPTSTDTEMIQKKKLELLNLENQLVGKLARQKFESAGAIDRELQAILEETGIAAGEARQVSGDLLAQRGATRSGAAIAGQHKIREQQFAQQAAARARADTVKFNLDQDEQDLYRRIRSARQRLESLFTHENIRQMEQIRYVQNTQQMEQQYLDFINELDIDEAAKQAAMAAWGGLAQSIGSLSGYGGGSLYGDTQAKKQARASGGDIGYSESYTDTTGATGQSDPFRQSSYGSGTVVT